jgi:hypothetical protein
MSGDTPLVIVSDDVLLSAGPRPREMDQALAAHFPSWSDFRQLKWGEEWTAGGIFDQASYGGSEYALNPAFLLVSVGMSQNWQPPRDGDLFLRAIQAAKGIFPLYVAFKTEKDVREAYPHIGNAATYALYRYYGENPQRLREWCTTYHTLFPPTTP